MGRPSLPWRQTGARRGIQTREYRLETVVAYGCAHALWQCKCSYCEAPTHAPKVASGACAVTAEISPQNRFTRVLGNA